MANHLAHETSPYLLQHRDNPVDWYPWGPDALDRARDEDRPILLSIGYAACHWCHVMEDESFEDPQTAALMNQHFVCIKVDREERPDLDAVYMDAVQAMTGHGGWPMTVFLTPAGVPFYGGTYFPPVDRHGLPAFKKLLLAIADTWRTRRDEVETQGKQLVEHIEGMALPKRSSELLDDSILQGAFRSLRDSFDPEHGGFGAAPKFPQSMTIDLLLRFATRGHHEAEEMARTTLTAMAAGGMFDQLGGGFARYSVDRAWIVPHFEKMLYDNAQLLGTYARASAAFGDPRYREVAEATAAWMLSEMRDPSGAFWSSLDADSEGVEGKFYVWTSEEIGDVVGADAAAAIEHWGFSDQGNFEGRNIPIYAAEPRDPDAIERARTALLARRAERVRPATDTKVLTAWNGMAIAALAEAGATVGRDDWIAAARAAMEFVLATLRVGGRLMRSYRATEAGPVVKHLGYCEDYAFVLEACLALFETTFEPRWLDEAVWAADDAIRLFADDAAGGFFTTGADAEQLVVRGKDLIDNATPSANSVLALELQRLALLTGEASYERHALDAIRIVRDAAVRSPTAFGHLLRALDFYTGDTREIVIVGDPQQQDARTLVTTVRKRPLLNKVLVAVPEGDGDLTARVPLLQGRERLGGKATAYVCRHGVCDLPVTEPRDLAIQLDG